MTLWRSGMSQSHGIQGKTTDEACHEQCFPLVQTFTLSTHYSTTYTHQLQRWNHGLVKWITLTIFLQRNLLLGNVGFLPLMWIPFAIALIDGSEPHSMTESPATLQVLLRNLTNSSRCRHGLQIPQILIWLRTTDLWRLSSESYSALSHRGMDTGPPDRTPGRSFDSWWIPSGVSIIWTNSIRLRSGEFGGRSHVLSPSSHSLGRSCAVLEVFQVTSSCCRGHCNRGQSRVVLWSPLKSSDQFKTEQHCESLA